MDIHQNSTHELRLGMRKEGVSTGLRTFEGSSAFNFHAVTSSFSTDFNTILRLGMRKEGV